MEHKEQTESQSKWVLVAIGYRYAVCVNCQKPALPDPYYLKHPEYAAAPFCEYCALEVLTGEVVEPIRDRLRKMLPYKTQKESILYELPTDVSRVLYGLDLEVSPPKGYPETSFPGKYDTTRYDKGYKDGYEAAMKVMDNLEIEKNKKDTDKNGPAKLQKFLRDKLNTNEWEAPTMLATKTGKSVAEIIEALTQNSGQISRDRGFKLPFLG